MKKKIFALLGVTSLLFSLSGCQLSSIADLESKLISEEDAMKDPQFWNNATLMDGQTNFYRIENPAFSGKPFTDIHKFGDCLLLVGQATYEDGKTNIFTPAGFRDSDTEEVAVSATRTADSVDTTDDNAVDSGTEDYGDEYYEDDYGYDEGEDYELSFEVYDPWRDTITKTLEHGVCTDDNYCIFDSGVLLTYSTDENDAYHMTVYNDELEQIAEADIECPDVNHDGEEDYFGSFYQLSDPDVFYSYCYSTDTYLVFTIDDQTITMETVLSPIDNFSICSASVDGSYMVCSGSDDDTCRDEIFSLDLSQPNVDTKKDIMTFESYTCGSFNGDHGLIEVPDYNNVFALLNGDSTVGYLYQPLLSNYMWSDGSYILVSSKLSEDSQSYYDDLALYGSDGSLKSACSYESEDVESEMSPYLLTDHLAVFEDLGFVFTLETNYSGDPAVVVWDCSKAGNESDPAVLYDDLDTLVETEEAAHSDEDVDIDNSESYCAVADPDNYDYGEWADARKLADQYEKTYGINIYIGPEVLEEMGGYNLSLPDDPGLAVQAMDGLTDVLDALPDGFLDQLRYGTVTGLNFYFTGAITSDSDESGNLDEAGAFVTTQGSREIMVVSCNYNWDIHYTICHELSHMIDNRLTYESNNFSDYTEFSEDTWASYNDSDFTYQSAYSDYTDATYEDDYMDYIWDDYGTTYPTEDRAEIFGYAFSAYLDDDYWASYRYSGAIGDKLDYYCECIRADYDSEGWPDKLPWEYMLDHRDDN